MRAEVEDVLDRLGLTYSKRAHRVLAGSFHKLHRILCEYKPSIKRRKPAKVVCSAALATDELNMTLRLFSSGDEFDMLLIRFDWEARTPECSAIFFGKWKKKKSLRSEMHHHRSMFQHSTSANELSTPWVVPCLKTTLLWIVA